MARRQEGKDERRQPEGQRREIRRRQFQEGLRSAHRDFNKVEEEGQYIPQDHVGALFKSHVSLLFSLLLILLSSTDICSDGDNAADTGALTKGNALAVLDLDGLD